MAQGDSPMSAPRRFLRHTWAKVLVIAVAALLVLGVAVVASASYTERSSFCTTACHEMAPYGSTWKASAHFGVPCVRCHIKPGTIELAKAKVSALREVYVHFAGQVKAPIAVTEHIPNATCVSCHPAKKIPTAITLAAASNPAPGASSTPAAGASPGGAPAASPSASAAAGRRAGPSVAFSHAAHAKGLLCIDCHSQVVHRSVAGRPYLDPTTMAFCLRCHDGKPASADCQTCHTAPHAARGHCVDCHRLGSWKTTFTHPVKLGKRHKTVLCEKCHTRAAPVAAPTAPPDMGFPAGCVDCHGNHHHDGKALLCAKCHVPSYYRPSTFRHPKTACLTCHKPPHPDRGTCLQCHTQHTWKSTFVHPVTLTGTHASFPCEKCHTSGTSSPPQSCQNCHKPPHPVYGSCLTCHSTTSWASHFAHPIALGGVHATFPCGRCHTNGINAPGAACTTCHGSNHGGLTNCAQCHTMSGWSPSTFHHPGAGEHTAGSFTCSACHPNNSFAKVYCSCHGGRPPSD